MKFRSILAISIFGVLLLVRLPPLLTAQTDNPAPAAEARRVEAESIRQQAETVGGNRDFAPAATLYQGLVAQNPEIREYRMELAKYLSWSGRIAESIVQYREILERNPNDLEARVALARVLSWNKQLEESLEEFARVLQADARNHEALVGRARVLSWKGEWDAALKLYDDLLIRAPQDREARFGKAQTLYWNGRPREAQAILEEMQAEYPQDREIALTAAGIHAALGQTSLALRQLDELDKLQPGHAEVDSLRRRIRQDLRPALILGFTPSVDSDDLAIYSSLSSLYFSPAPQVHSYLLAGITPSHNPTSSQTGRELLFGSYGRVTNWLMLRGEVGGNSATSGRQGAIGSGGATVYLSDRMQLDLDASRRFLNYIPRPVLLGINRIELRTSWDWRASRRTSFHVDYYHQRYSDTNRNHGGNFTLLENLVRKERVEVETGYLYSVSGFAKNIQSGYFAPSQLQRHALLFNLRGKISPRLGFYFWGSLGGEQIFHNPFRLDGTARFSWDVTLSPHLRFAPGYGYFAISSVATAGAYTTQTGYLTLEFRF